MAEETKKEEVKIRKTKVAKSDKTTMDLSKCIIGQQDGEKKLYENMKLTEKQANAFLEKCRDMEIDEKEALGWLAKGFTTEKFLIKAETTIKFSI